jgi:calcineurin-like phosphoesterase family protein
MKRRQFIQTAVGAGSLLILPVSLKAFAGSEKQNLKFGICADIHKDIMHDSDERLQTFIDKASARDLDFIIQLGDFCRPYDYNRKFLSIWNSYPGKKFHVIGNHEMDGGFSRKDVIRFWNIPEQYYSFNSNGFHIIVLDGNDKNHSKHRAAGYARYIGDKQIKWLKKDLKSTHLPCLVFSHQSLEKNRDGIENREQIRALLEAENSAAGATKIVACFSGHHHTDYATNINGIYYIQINSMSYKWMGKDWQVVRYSKAIDEKYPYIKFTAPFKDPLFAFVEINAENLKIEGKKSTFVGITPKEMGYPERPPNNPVTSVISDRNLKI